MGPGKLCLRWDDFENNVSQAFKYHRGDKDFFDETLVCDDEQIQAHKMTCQCLFPLLPKYPLQLTVTEAPCFTLTLTMTGKHKQVLELRLTMAGTEGKVCDFVGNWLQCQTTSGIRSRKCICEPSGGHWSVRAYTRWWLP